MILSGSRGILGINARNLLYIKAYNPKKAIKLADNKLKTKKFLEARGVPVPKLINSISTREDAEKFDFDSLPNSFVIKPNFGFGGEGIIPIANRREKCWITVSGKKIDKEFLFDHIIDILDGRFSISNIADSAFFEQRLISHESISPYTYEGLPDIRIIVYNLVPIMAMLRLPTKESGGKGNLHQGAVGVGIDIATGKTTYIAKKNKIVDEIPDIGRMDNLKIPFWDDILHIASKVQLVTNLGYLAVDIALDKSSGPVLLEINARAGLGVQIANLAPLRKRLERVQGVKVTSPEKGVRIAKDMFGKTIEKEIKNISGKQVIGGKEDVELILKKGTSKVTALVDSSQERSTLDAKLAEELSLLDGQSYDDEQSTLKLKFTLKSKRIRTIVDIEKIPEENNVKMIIGARDLQDFLIDPSATKEGESSKNTTKKVFKRSIPKKKIKNHFEIDQEIVNVDNKLKLLFHLRPVNLEEEKKKFLENFSYNPQFEYPELKFNPTELKQRLEKIEETNTPLGEVFRAKKEELMKKIELIESIDTEKFTRKSVALFGEPEGELIEECENLLLESKKFTSAEKEDINEEGAKTRFEKVFKKYKLNNWKVKIKDEMVTDCIAGKNNRLFVRKGSKFSEERIEKLIIHEIETHILTAENGKTQPYEIFNRGLSDYLITQEGLATYNVTNQSNQTIKDSYKALALVIATKIAMTGSFVQTFEKVLSYGIPIDHALRVALKVKRGLSDTSKPGAFTKDIIYYKGYKEIVEFVENGGKIKDLYIGKLNLKDLDFIKKIEGLNEPKYLPKWL
jgi:alpha-L-glutamate ligase-like protein/uncharacterized protein (TIGR02421 family)